MTDSSGTADHLIVWANPAAGHGRTDHVVAELTAAAERRGHRVEVLPSGDLGATADAARTAIAAGADRLIALGGDGTVHQAIQVVAGTDVTFGLVPTGTGNDFAGAFGLPTDPAAAIDCALGPTAPVDLMRVGSIYAATVVTLGLSVDVTVRAGRLRRPRGPAKYTVATLLEIPRMRQMPLIVDVDGEHHEMSPNLLAIANTTTFGGGMRIAPDADPSDGLVDVIAIGPTSRRSMLGLLPRAKTGGHVGHRAVTVLRGRRVALETIGTSGPVRVDADGEQVGETPITIETAPAALRLACG